MINILSTIANKHTVDTALFRYLADKEICLLVFYVGDHLIKGSSECKVLINEGKQGCPSILYPGAETDAQIPR